jgi:hypothetical protein
VRFTPAAGTTITFDGLITELGADCGGVEAWVRRGGATLSSTTAINSGAPWAFSSSAASGDAVEVYIGPGANYYCDHAMISMTVTGCAPTPAASAIGDPHLQNIHGERFDLMKPGKHVLVNIPREARAESAMLRVEADARRLGRSCADLYFEELNITGLWAEAKQAGGYHYGSSSGVEESPEWLTFGKVAAKVVHGRTQDGVQYLNLYVKHLGRAGFVVGGLLGEDDYHDVAAPDASCANKIALDLGIRTNSPDTRSFAIASAA